MHFTSESERLNHPLASRIIKDVWDAYFNSELTGPQQELMQISQEALVAREKELNNRSDFEKLQFWLCCAANKTISDSQLLALFDTNVIPKSQLLFRAVLSGRFTLVTEVMSRMTADDVQSMEKGITHRDLQFMIKHPNDSYWLFNGPAPMNGRWDIMEKLMTLVPDQITPITVPDYSRPFQPCMLYTRNGYEAFARAASRGYWNVMQKFMAIPTINRKHLLERAGYSALVDAIRAGHFNVIEGFKSTPDFNMKAALEYNDYLAVRCCTEGEGRWNVLEDFLNFPGINLAQMAGTYGNGYEIFTKAAQANQRDIARKMLPFSVVFSRIEPHTREYGEQYVHPFINEKLSALRLQRQNFELENPTAVFDITNPEEALLCFYIIKNLVRRNDPALLDNLRFLLEIPAIKALVPKKIERYDQENEIFRLALRVGNTTAAEILLNITAVRELAEANDYYRQEVSGAMDLRALAHDRESSMHALSTGEQKRLEAAISLYKPLMREKGVENLFNDLKKQLVQRYEANPAQITVNGAKLSLPLSWQEFNKLTLTSTQREEALKAYYQNADHTAWRYLSKPNSWMANDASYVLINPENRNERWSTFEEYKSLIVMLWCAAKDENTPAIDGHTLTGRLDHFIDELAHIGRAHNWDDIRPKMVAKIGSDKKPLRDTEGEIIKTPLLDSSGAVVTEEYDNLKGDKPSCYSGVKRRLFQSVVGHPQLKILTLDDIKQELRDFVRDHFTAQINDGNKKDLLTVWNRYLASGELEDAKPLRALDITPAQQQAFLQHLIEKYDFQFTSDSKFRKYIETEFALIENDSRPSDCMHALKFDGLIQLDSLLRRPPISPVLAAGVFSQTAAATQAVNDPKLLVMNKLIEISRRYGEGPHKHKLDGLLQRCRDNCSTTDDVKREIDSFTMFGGGVSTELYTALRELSDATRSLQAPGRK